MDFAKNDKNLHLLIKYLKEHDIDPERARKIIHKSVTINPTNRRSLWKMHRLHMYVRQRLKEHINQGANNGKKRSVIIVVQSDEFRKAFKTYPFGYFNEAKEIKNLYTLITDPRQQIHFTTKNFTFPNNKKNIPQDLLDKIC